MSTINPIYLELAARIQESDTEYIPRILARLANPEQARILKFLPDTDRDPAAGRSLKVSDQFLSKVGLTREVVEKHLQELFEKGVVFPTRGGPQMARTWMQLHDSSLMNPKFDTALGPEYFDLWAAAHALSRKPITVDLNLHPEVAPMRVVPRWKAIKDIPGILPSEDLRAMIQAQDTIVLSPCGCKRSYRNRQCGIPEESCLSIGRAGQYNLERHLGKKISPEEALQVMEKFEKYPVINLVVNQREVTQLICNCHICCCGALIEGVASSRFLATVDTQACRACGACVKRCQFGANSLRTEPQTGSEKAYTDAAKCKGCGDCVIACPHGARGMKIVRPPEYIPASLSIY